MAIAIALLNIGRMYPATMIAITYKTVRVGDCQLPTKHKQDFHRHSRGFVRQNTDEANGSQQNGIAQAVMVAP